MSIKVSSAATAFLWMLASYRGEFPEEKKARKFLENYEYREDTQSQTNEQQEETLKQPMNDSRYEAYQSMWFLRQLLNAEPHISPETKFSTRYFTVSIDTANTITDVNVSHDCCHYLSKMPKNMDKWCWMQKKTMDIWSSINICRQPQKPVP